MGTHLIEKPHLTGIKISLGSGGIFGRGSGGDLGLGAISLFRENARPREPIAIKPAPPIISQCGNSIDESMPIYFFAIGSSVVSCRSGQSYNPPLTLALTRSGGAPCAGYADGSSPVGPSRTRLTVDWSSLAISNTASRYFASPEVWVAGLRPHLQPNVVLKMISCKSIGHGPSKM